MPPIVNIAAYKFVTLDQLGERRVELRALCNLQQLRGTILLSPEGINLFVAGARDGVDALLSRLRQIPALADLTVKESLSDEQPFNRMLVKLKREIIPFGRSEVDPIRSPSRRLSPRELKRWLDEGRAFTLLDARNNFEVKVGTFRDAVAIDVDNFRDFPEALNRLPEDFKRRPLVTFCTGGIRCEKAAPLLEREGFQDVYQLDGGILKYFEECGGKHYQGTCFVFDRRVAVDTGLREVETKLCFACQATLSVEDQASSLYIEGRSCPHCHRSPEQKLAELLGRRHAAIRAATTPLPGSVPYDNVRPLSVPLRLDRVELLDFLDAMRTQVSREEWQEICRQGQLECRGELARPGRIVRAGERYLHHLPASREPDVSAEIEIVHEDEAVVVVNKPAPLPMHPCGRFNRNSLLSILNQVYRPVRLRPLHRLDADTTGVVLFSKTRQVARQVQPQFKTNSVTKTYLACVHGRPPRADFTSNSPISVTGDRGVRTSDEGGYPARTRFRVLKKFENETTLLEVTPLTGRTNQIRVHLWELELPIVGDPIYQSDRTLGEPKTLSPQDPPLCLHAASIEFLHPFREQRVRYLARQPAWASDTQ